MLLVPTDLPDGVFVPAPATTVDGDTTVDIRSKRRSLVRPPRALATRSSPPIECGCSSDSHNTARHRPEWDSAPTSRCAVLPQPQCSGGSGRSTQSHWVYSPGGCSMTATARSFVGRQGSHAGRSPRARSCRVSVG